MQTFGFDTLLHTALTDAERRKAAAQELSMKPQTPNSSSAEDAEKRVALLRQTGLL